MAVKKSYDMIPRKTERIETKHRRVVTDLPVPESATIIEKLRKYEPRSMSGQPLVIWDRAEGFNVYDKYGNKFIDFSSGVLVTNAGHANPMVKKAAADIIEHGLMHNYCFPTEVRANLVEKLVESAPEGLDKCFLLTTGSEATECAIKLMRTYGRTKSDKKIKIITFNDDFHGRTMGAQLAGGSAGGKAWIVNHDPDMHTLPYPNAFYYDWADETRDDYDDDKCFETFMGYMRDAGIDPKDIAGFLPESYQGGWVQLMPKGFAQRLRKLCDDNDILLGFDEVQAGFGRTGKLFCYEHYGIKADLICCGKGISSSMPLSAVLGRADVMDLYGPNEMTSTHTGNPVCAAAALASVTYIVENDLAGNAARLGEICAKKLSALAAKYPQIGFMRGTGLAWALIITKPGTKELDNDTAHDIVRNAIEAGLLFFAPVGSGSCIKVTPPLVITEEALIEGLDAFDQAIARAVS